MKLDRAAYYRGVEEANVKFGAFLGENLVDNGHPLFDGLTRTLKSFAVYTAPLPYRNAMGLSIISTIVGETISLDKLPHLHLTLAKRMLVKHGAISPDSSICGTVLKNRFYSEFSNVIKLYHAQRLMRVGRHRLHHSLVYQSTLSEMLAEQAALTESVADNKAQYRYRCSFPINVNNIQLIRGYDRLCKMGWYDKNHNPFGVVKDHRFSINHGFMDKVSPSVVGHPANCEFLSVVENSSKGDECSLSLDELKKEIHLFEDRFRLLQEDE